jgi:hypothetical protein
MALYGYPDVGRFGLGHGLLAWARCVVWCELTGATMLAPIWLRPRLGPYLRNERDKREYFKLFQPGAAIGFPKRELVLLTSNKIKGVDGFFRDDILDERFIETSKTENRSVVVQFENAVVDNELKHFREVLDYPILLRQELLAITRPRHLPVGIAKGTVAIHVRLGDFMKPNAEQEPSKNQRLPIEWYREALLALRAQLSADVPAVVFSDGSDEELAPLLTSAHVERAPKRESITDMLSIAQAGVLIASASGFSHWGAFLGQIPTIHRKGARRVVLLGDQKEFEWGTGDQYSSDFLDLCKRSMGNV